MQDEEPLPTSEEEGGFPELPEQRLVARESEGLSQLGASLLVSGVGLGFALCAFGIYRLYRLFFPGE